MSVHALCTAPVLNWVTPHGHPISCRWPSTPATCHWLMPSAGMAMVEPTFLLRRHSGMGKRLQECCPQEDLLCHSFSSSLEAALRHTWMKPRNVPSHLQGKSVLLTSEQTNVTRSTLIAPWELIRQAADSPWNPGAVARETATVTERLEDKAERREEFSSPRASGGEGSHRVKQNAVQMSVKVRDILGSLFGHGPNPVVKGI